MKPKNKEIKEPSGWQGNIYYPDGPGGQGFGIEVLPNGRVWFPRIPLIAEIDQEMCQKKDSHSSKKDSMNTSF